MGTIDNDVRSFFGRCVNFLVWREKHQLSWLEVLEGSHEIYCLFYDDLEEWQWQWLIGMLLCKKCPLLLLIFQCHMECQQLWIIWNLPLSDASNWLGLVNLMMGRVRENCATHQNWLSSFHLDPFCNILSYYLVSLIKVTQLTVSTTSQLHWLAFQSPDLWMPQ